MVQAMNLANTLVDVQALGAWGGAFLTSAHPVNDLAGAIAITDDASERMSDFLRFWPSGA